MTSGADEPGRSREDILAATARRYEWYRASGYADRWAMRSVGATIAIADRDEWVLAALAGVVGTVVDLGSGAGDLAALMDQAGVRPDRYVGIDLIQEHVEAAAVRVGWAEFYRASADETPIADQTASAVVAMTLFSSLPDEWFRRRVAAEVDRILKPGGRVVVYDLRYPSPGNRHVRPVSRSALTGLFPGWPLEDQSLTVLPPLARSLLAAGSRRYAFLESLPILRSHIGAVITKPAADQIHEDP